MSIRKKTLYDEQGFPIRSNTGKPFDAIWDEDNENLESPNRKVTTTTTSIETVTGGGSTTIKRVEPKNDPFGIQNVEQTTTREDGANLTIVTTGNADGTTTTNLISGVRDEPNAGGGLDAGLGVAQKENNPPLIKTPVKEKVEAIGETNTELTEQFNAGTEIMEDFSPETEVNVEQKAVKTSTKKIKSEANSPKAGIRQDKDNRVVVPNFLHNLASYTYNFELYIMTPGDYNAFANDPNYAIENQPGRLLIKTGGGNYKNRNPYFKLDYYIDDLEIDSIIGPGSSRGTTNTGVTFKITEPYGMTLLNSFVMAANYFGSYNYVDQPYLLKVFITGYDSTGKYIGTTGLGQRTRYIPIRFTDFKFGVTEQGTVYNVEAIPYNSMGNYNTNATVPIDLQIPAKTVSDFFNVALTTKTTKTEMRTSGGPPNQQINQEVPVIEKQLEKGLTGYLNKLEDEHVKKKLKGVPDLYAFEIDEDIADSKITVQQAIDLSKTKGEQDANKKASAQFLSNFVFDEATKTYTIRAGTSIVNVIHSILRSSEYMINQVVSADLKQSTGASEDYEENQDKPIDFYRIVPSIKLGPFDKIRNCYAKFITFVVKKFEMTGKDYENLGQKRVEFIAKNYDYFYTGKNTDIMSFDIDFNAAYFQSYTFNTMKKAGQFPTPLAEQNLDSIHEGQTAKSGNSPITKWTPYIRTVVTQTGTDKGINDPQSEHKAMTVDKFMQDVFDQGADLLEMNMRIVGDMSYIQSKDIRSVALSDNFDYYLPDGSLNTDKEWHIFVRFRNPIDVNASTGLMQGFNINEDGVTDVNTPSINGQYRIVEVTSNFSNGQFTQNLKCLRERNQELNTLKKSDDKKDVERKDTEKETTQNNSGSSYSNDAQGTATSGSGGFSNDAQAVSTSGGGGYANDAQSIATSGSGGFSDDAGLTKGTHPDAYDNYQDAIQRLPKAPNNFPSIPGNPEIAEKMGMAKEAIGENFGPLPRPKNIKRPAKINAVGGGVDIGSILR